VCCSVLQCVAVRSINFSVSCSVPSIYCSVLQCVAMCCFVLQCIAVCCSACKMLAPLLLRNNRCRVLHVLWVCCSVLQSLNRSCARNPGLTPLHTRTHTRLFFLFVFFSFLSHAPNPWRYAHTHVFTHAHVCVYT